MSKVKMILCCTTLCMMSLSPYRSSAQQEEIEQLLLDVQKLAQLKQILSEMYKGYQVVSRGYTVVKDLSQGNFTLHKDFLDGLLQVSPTVQHYKKIADIVSLQLRIVKEGKHAMSGFQADKQFSAAELNYLGRLYNHLFTQSINCLDELIMILTSGQLRMSDNDRLAAIDRIYEEVSGQYAFLKQMNTTNALLSINREHEQQDIDASKKRSGIN